MSRVRVRGADLSRWAFVLVAMLGIPSLGCVPRSADLAAPRSTFPEGTVDSLPGSDVSAEDIGRLARTAGFKGGDYLDEAERLAPAGPYLPIPRGRPAMTRSRTRGTFAPGSQRNGTFAPIRGRGETWAQPGERGTWGQGALAPDGSTIPAAGDRGTFGNSGDFLPIRGAGSRNLPLGGGNVTFGSGQQWIQPSDRTTVPR